MPATLLKNVQGQIEDLRGYGCVGGLGT